MGYSVNYSTETADCQCYKIAFIYVMCFTITMKNSFWEKAYCLNGILYCKTLQISHTLNLAAQILEKKVFRRNQKKSKVKS